MSDVSGIIDLEKFANNRRISEFEVVHKFGRNAAVGTSFVPISIGGIYRTPQVSGATKLRVKAGNVNDAPAGTGARKIVLQGLNELGEEVTEEVATNGTSAGPNSTNDFIRLYRAYVSESGSYATTSVASHAADIVIENAAGTEDWLTIDATDYARAQSEVADYTVPLGKTAYINNIQYSISSSKAVDLLLFQRRDILDTSAPYKAARLFFSNSGVNTQNQADYNIFFGPFPELTDIGTLAKVGSTTGDVSVNFTILLQDN